MKKDNLHTDRLFPSGSKQGSAIAQSDTHIRDAHTAADRAADMLYTSETKRITDSAVTHMLNN